MRTKETKPIKTYTYYANENKYTIIGFVIFESLNKKQQKQKQNLFLHILFPL